MTAREQIADCINKELLAAGWNPMWVVGNKFEAVILDEIEAYGEKCQRDALERAAAKADSLCFVTDGVGIAAEIRTLAPREVEP